MSLRTTNLNLLPILRALLREASVSRAAAELCLSQPATSNALSRLRELLGDPLLIQVGRTMRLTPRAHRLLPKLDTACSTIEALLHEAEFVPWEAECNFTIATPDYVALLLGAELIGTLEEHAPRVSVRFINVAKDFHEQLAVGATDLAIVAWDDDMAKGFSALRGYTDYMVGVANADHAFVREPPKTVAEVAACPQIGVDLGFQPPGQFYALSQSMKTLSGRLRLSTSHVMTLPLLVSQTECVAVVPNALAVYAGKMVNIHSFELPGEKIEIDACIMWSPTLGADPANSWFRGILDALMCKHFNKKSAETKV